MGRIGKRGLFFSTDALVALIVIFLTILVIYPIVTLNIKESYTESDVIKVLSTLKIGEVDDSYAKSLIENNQIRNINKSLLEQIGEFCVENVSAAQELSQSVLSNLDLEKNFGIWYGSKAIYLRNSSPYEESKNILVDRRVISGIKEGNGSTGYSGSAYLSNDIQTKYFYFGGYMGDGNITVIMNYSGDLTGIEMEIAINSDFKAYINGNFSGQWENSSDEYTPKKYDLSAYYNNFHSGSNNITLIGNNLHIAGGFIKIIYQNASIYEEPNRYYFPGIDGIINLYDGFYSPGTINNMNILLHFNSSLRMFLNIGNTTVYNGSSSDEITLIIDDANLSSILNYTLLSNKTIPIRLGLEEIAGGGQGGNADVVLITDLSGSMDYRLDSDSTSGRVIISNCSNPAIYNPTTQRLSLAKCLDMNFTSTVLSGTGNKLALVSFSNSANSYINLTNNKTLLNNTIIAYTIDANTCLSCAINRAYIILKQQSGPTRKKFIVVMTDGVTNMRSTNTCIDLYGAGNSAEDTIFSSGANGFIFQRNSSNEWNFLNSSVTNSLNDIELYNSTLGFSVGNTGRILKYNGTGFVVETSPTAVNLNAIDIFNESCAIAVGASGVVIKWNGTRWTSLGVPSATATLNSVSMYNTSLLFAAGVRSSYGRIYRSTNGGSSWSEVYQSSGFGSNLRGIKVLNSTKAYAVGNNGEIISWNGASWSSISTPTGDDLYNIESFNITEIYAVGGDNEEATIIKHNGTSWSVVYTYPSSMDSLRDIITINGNIYAIGEKGTIIEYNSGTWKRSFNLSYAFMGLSSTGLDCADDNDCSQEDSFSALNAKYSSCYTRMDTNATIYSIGFGNIASCSFANQTLKEIADCGNGSFYASTDAAALQSFYSKIAFDILKVSYSEQSSNVSGNIFTKLYPDSYIEFNYTKTKIPYGLMISVEAPFSDTNNINFDIPYNTTLIDTKLVSYSGPRWTRDIIFNSNLVYNLSLYGEDYRMLGDPYSIYIPINLVNISNNAQLTTGISSLNYSNGSLSNKVIYRIVKNMSSYSQGIYHNSEGCSWIVQFEDYSNLTFSVPNSYNGSSICYYQYNRHELGDSNDAINIAVDNLLMMLDLNSNGRLDVKFSEQNLDIGSSQISGIPYSERITLEVRTWD